MSDPQERPKQRVFVCQGSNCRPEGGPEVMAGLQQAFQDEAAIEVEPFICFGACAVSPNVVVVPDRLWFSYAYPEYVDDVAQAIRKGEEMSGLANHVRPDVQRAVFDSLEAK